MVEREGLLEAVRRLVPAGEHRARVVGEHVDARVRRTQFVGEAPHLGQLREVGDMLVNRGAGAGAAGELSCLANSCGVPSHDRYVGAALRQFDGCCSADSACRAGDHHQRHATTVAVGR